MKKNVLVFASLGAPAIVALAACMVTVQPIAAQTAATHPAAGAIIPHPAWGCGMPGGIPAPERGGVSLTHYESAN